MVDAVQPGADDVVGSKLATRGHAGEAYYIFDINPNMFIKLSGIYYDFEYTGSGPRLASRRKSTTSRTAQPIP